MKPNSTDAKYDAEFEKLVAADVEKKLHSMKKAELASLVWDLVRQIILLRNSMRTSDKENAAFQSAAFEVYTDLSRRLSSYKACSKIKHENAEKKKAYFLERYDHWEPTMPTKKKARELANKDTIKEFGSGWEDDRSRQKVVFNRTK